MLSQGPNDYPLAPIGDTQWVGVNMRIDPALLPPGYASEAVNMRFRRGVAETRLGTMVMPWLNKVDIPTKTFGAWGTIYGQGVFSDPNTHFDYTIIAADGNVYQTTENNVPIQLNLPSGVTITSPVTFTQAFDKLVMWRGPDLPPLLMLTVANGFDYVPAPESGSGAQPIPNASRAIFFQNRLIIPHGDDEIAVSDIGDITQYSETLNDFRINQGTTDKIVNIVKFNDETLIIFKERSIYQVTGVTGDLSGVSLDQVTLEYGCVAAESIVQTGSDVWFLSQLGVMSLKQTQFNKLQSTAIPISEPIQPLIDRINWRYASGACGALWDSKYYLAVPLDDARVRRESLIAYGSPSGFGRTITVPVTPGGSYEFVAGTETNSLANGTETITASKVFTAQGSTVTLTVQIGQAFTGALYPVLVGVNTHVLVFDFLNQAWSGYDTASGIEPVKFFLTKKQERQRLFFINKDGWLMLYEEDYVDQLVEPYAILQVGSNLANGDTISVNGGATITAVDGTVNNGATTWGISVGDPQFNVQQLYGGVAQSVNGYGYGGAYGSAPTAWSAPHATFGLVYDPTLTGPSFGGPFSGLKITATDGKVPTITTSGSWATVTYVNQLHIDSYLITRGYTSNNGDEINVQRADLDVQTWSPSLTIQTYTPGVNESKTITSGFTRDRTKYYEPAKAPAYDATNTNDDFLTPYRQDYSVAMPAGGIYLGTSGVAYDLMQEARLNFNCYPTIGRSAQFKIRNTNGRMRIMSLRAVVTNKPPVQGVSV